MRVWFIKEIYEQSCKIDLYRTLSEDRLITEACMIQLYDPAVKCEHTSTKLSKLQML